MANRQGPAERSVRKEEGGGGFEGRHRPGGQTHAGRMSAATSGEPTVGVLSKFRDVRSRDRAGKTRTRPVFPRSLPPGAEGGGRHGKVMADTDRTPQTLPGAVMARDASVRQGALRYLFRERQKLLETTGAVREGGPDLLEVAQEIEEERVWLAVLDRSYAAQRELDRAIEFLAEGRYGRCADCDRRIPLGRLRALPFAVRCVVCQERYELQYAHRVFEPRDQESRLASWQDSDAA